MTLSKHSAAPTCAGYVYQLERALYWLAQSPAGTAVGIETLDDVAVLQPDSKVLEQDKHSLDEEAQPFDDRSPGLWKTLSIWIEALCTGEVKASSTRFLMVTNITIDDGLVRHIGNAKSDKEIDDCVAALKKAVADPPDGIKRYLAIVFKPERNGALRELIRQCEFVDGAQSTNGGELRSNTISHLQIPEWCISQGDSIANELLGWMEQSAMSAWRRKEPAWIKRDLFVNQFSAILDRRRREVKRERAEHLIEVTEDGIGSQKGSTFVKQLHLITDDEYLVDNAIREFIRCNIEKSRLSEEGNITDEDWITFERTLHTRWDKIQRRLIRMQKGQSEQDLGFEIFSETTESHRELLAGIVTDQIYLTSGTYHRLANMIKLGWHPRYAELIDEPTKQHD
jgi:hypothetical protein